MGEKCRFHVPYWGKSQILILTKSKNPYKSLKITKLNARKKWLKLNALEIN